MLEIYAWYEPEKIYFMLRIRIRWDEELRWLVDWIFFFFLTFFVFFVYSVYIKIYVLFFFFTACTSIIFFLPYCKNLRILFTFVGLLCAHQSFFFFHIVRTSVLSLFFLVYSVHINHFFLFYFKNLYTFFVFFFVYSVHINHFFLL